MIRTGPFFAQHACRSAFEQLHPFARACLLVGKSPSTQVRNFQINSDERILKDGQLFRKKTELAHAELNKALREFYESAESARRGTSETTQVTVEITDAQFEWLVRLGVAYDPNPSATERKANPEKKGRKRLKVACSVTGSRYSPEPSAIDVPSDRAESVMRETGMQEGDGGLSEIDDESPYRDPDDDDDGGSGDEQRTHKRRPIPAIDQQDEQVVARVDRVTWRDENAEQFKPSAQKLLSTEVERCARACVRMRICPKLTPASDIVLQHRVFMHIKRKRAHTNPHHDAARGLLRGMGSVNHPISQAMSLLRAHRRDVNHIFTSKVRSSFSPNFCTETLPQPL